MSFDLETSRLRLETVAVSHAGELFDLFNDPELHRFVELETPTYDEQFARCQRWAERKSPDGDEPWYWIARERSSGEVIGSFQATMRRNGDASVGYLVRRASQGRGFATEAMRAILDWLRQKGAERIEASVTADNLASIRLAEKIGMAQALVIRNGACFKGLQRDEILFQMELPNLTR